MELLATAKREGDHYQTIIACSRTFNHLLVQVGTRQLRATRLAPIAQDHDVTLPAPGANSTNTAAHSVCGLTVSTVTGQAPVPCVSSIRPSQPRPSTTSTTPIARRLPSLLYHRRQHVRPARPRPLCPAHGSAHPARRSSPCRPHHLPQLQLREPQAIRWHRRQRVQPGACSHRRARRRVWRVLAEVVALVSLSRDALHAEIWIIGTAGWAQHQVQHAERPCS
jgi:hypothetical protein